MDIEQEAWRKSDIIGEFIPLQQQTEGEQEPSIEQKYQELVQQLGYYAVLNEDFRGLFIERIGNPDIRELFERANGVEYGG